MKRFENGASGRLAVPLLPIVTSCFCDIYVYKDSGIKPSKRIGSRTIQQRNNQPRALSARLQSHLCMCTRARLVISALFQLGNQIITGTGIPHPDFDLSEAGASPESTTVKQKLVCVVVVVIVVVSSRPNIWRESYRYSTSTYPVYVLLLSLTGQPTGSTRSLTTLLPSCTLT